MQSRLTAAIPTPVQEIMDRRIQTSGVRLLVKRDDLIHPLVSGNKWRKLQGNLRALIEMGHHQLLTFGGAYSNHIYATAAAGRAMGIQTIGIIRGDRVEPLNPTLSFAAQQGMKLVFISRSDYRNRKGDGFINQLLDQFGDFYLIPDGGTNELALEGVAAMVKEINLPFNYICSPVGTGGTLAGIVKGLGGRGQALGFPVLKAESLYQEIQGLLGPGKNHQNFRLLSDFHFGGYLRFDRKLIDFINEFQRSHAIRLDPIYTGKMFYGLFELIQSGFFPQKSVVVAYHSGGLQGIEGFNQRFGKLIH